MATTDRVAETTISAQTARASLEGRNRLAMLVVFGSFLTLFLLVGALIGLANQPLSEAAKTAFTSVLPVLAGWVGTVLAFYFSAASHQASLETISRAGAGPAPSAPVSEKMIPEASIFGLRKLEEKEGARPRDIPIRDLQQDFEKPLPSGARVTRLLFVESGVFKYILHKATLDAFIVKNLAQAAEKSFADMLADDETLRQVSKLVVFVSASTTLGEAKAALDKVSGSQDIIVTGSGNAAEPMLGWLSNVDLTKALQVS